jgi:predicted RNase H-like nuclease (RuvC/YqgF family)
LDTCTTNQILNPENSCQLIRRVLIALLSPSLVHYNWSRYQSRRSLCNITGTSMSRRYSYIERDRHGRERFVRRRSTSYEHEDRSSRRDQFEMAEQRVQDLDSEVNSLQTRLSVEQRNVHILQQQLQRLTQDHSQARHFQQLYLDSKDECAHLNELLYKEEKKTKKLQEKYDDISEKYRMMKRGVSQHDHEAEYYRVLYEEKLQEVELLRIRAVEKDERHHLDQARIDKKDESLREKNQTISYFREYLRSHGFRVDA